MYFFYVCKVSCSCEYADGIRSESIRRSRGKTVSLFYYYYYCKKKTHFFCSLLYTILSISKRYKNDPEILAMTNLVAAYQRNEIIEFEKILKVNKLKHLSSCYTFIKTMVTNGIVVGM